MAEWAAMDLVALKQLKSEKEDRLRELEETRVEDVDEVLEARLAVLRIELDEAAAEETVVPPPEVATSVVVESNLDDIDEEVKEGENNKFCWPYKGWKKDWSGNVTPFMSEVAGRCLKTVRDVKKGEVLFCDESCLEVPSVVSGCLVSSGFGAAVGKFRAAARDGKAVIPHELKTKKLDDGVVILQRIKKQGEDAEQGFDLAPTTVTGVVFKDGALPILVQYLENNQQTTTTTPRPDIFDLYCPLKEADAAQTRKYLCLSTAFINSLVSLPQYQSVLTPDQAVKLLLIVQANSISIKRRDYTGVAVFPLASLMQHDCNPNAVAAVLHKTGDCGESRLKVIAQQDIAKNTPISISYGGTYHTISERRSLLQSSHYFTCTCDGCMVHGDPARGFSLETTPDWTCGDLVQENEKLQEAMKNSVREYSMTCPVGVEGREWVGERGLSDKNEKDNFKIRELVGVEGDARNRWSGVRKALESNPTDWTPLTDYLETYTALHPTHYIITSLLASVLPVALRTSPPRALWILRHLTNSQLHIDLPPAAAPTLSDYCELAARINTSSAKWYITQGVSLLTAAGLTETTRHRQLDMALQLL